MVSELTIANFWSRDIRCSQCLARRYGRYKAK